MEQLIFEVGLALALIASAGLLAAKVRFSIVPVLVLAGMVVGPHAPKFGMVDLRFIESAPLIEFLGRVGVLFLLFYLGLEFSVGRLIKAGRSIAAAGAIYMYCTPDSDYITGEVVRVGPAVQKLAPGDRIVFSYVDKATGQQVGEARFDPAPQAVPDRGVVGGFFHWLFQGMGFQQPENEDFIKRVIGLPGEVVEGKNGAVYVNGTKLDEPYLTQKTRPFDPVTVPAGKLFVMGDNRANSLDSRFGLGYVPMDKVIGKAFVKIWPPSRFGLLH